jgi:hypothetical protein
MKCVVHIGIEKTGTTAIQRALSQNRGTLISEGIALGWSEEMYSSRFLVARFRREPDDYWDEKGWKTESDRLEGSKLEIDRFNQELDSLPSIVSTVIVSCEHFHSRL